MTDTATHTATAAAPPRSFAESPPARSDITHGDKPPVFVFGSNLAGRHGKGAALWARMNRGAQYGRGFGLQGNSYAIPTKDHSLRPLPFWVIEAFVWAFLDFARLHPQARFEVTPIGCGLAGFKPEQIAPAFRGAPPNVELPPEFKAVLG